MNLLHPLSPEQVVQKSVEGYNRRDIRAFMECFSQDIALHTFPDPEPTLEGLEAIQNFYKQLFEASPKLNATILNRIIFNNKVIDHERIIGRQGSDVPLEIVVMYEVNEGKIIRLTALRNWHPILKRYLTKRARPSIRLENTHPRLILKEIGY